MAFNNLIDVLDIDKLIFASKAFLKVISLLSWRRFGKPCLTGYCADSSSLHHVNAQEGPKTHSLYQYATFSAFPGLGQVALTVLPDDCGHV